MNELEELIGDEKKDEHKCEMCGALMIKKQGPFGQFWGCTNFPFCKHTTKTILRPTAI